jgi:hypothetical protein
MGWNVYLHCDGGLADGEPLVGYEMLLSDFGQYDTQIPVMVRLARALLVVAPNRLLTYSSAFRS